MNTFRVYSSKAEKYARYRWNYSPFAVEAVFETTRLPASAVAADIGAGTGILTRHFAGRVGQLLAIEPNLEMRSQAARHLYGLNNCEVLGGSAEQLPLCDHSLDLILAGQAVHWFNADLARPEFRRVMKQGGWLALFRNYGTHAAFNRTMGTLMKAEYGVDLANSANPPMQTPPESYFGTKLLKLTYPFEFQQSWDEFLGALLSASYMPGETHPAFPALAIAAHQIFDEYSTRGLLPVSGVTELLLGQLA